LGSESKAARLFFIKTPELDDLNTPLKIENYHQAGC